MPSRIAAPLLIVMAALVVAFAFRLQGQASRDEGRLEASVQGDTLLLRWSSPIEHPMELRLKEAFARHGADASRIVLELDSPGGALREGRRVVERLAQWKRTHRVDTAVGRGRSCLSMCVPVFLQGEARRAAPDAQFMFHEPSSRNAVTGERVERPRFEQRRAADRFFRRYFEASPMNPDWRAALYEAWRGQEVWTTGAALHAAGSGVVTDLRPD